MSAPPYDPHRPLTVDEALRLLTPVARALSVIGAAAIAASNGDAERVNALSDKALGTLEGLTAEMRKLLGAADE